MTSVDENEEEKKKQKEEKIENKKEEVENKQWKEIREKLVEDVELTLNIAVEQSSHRRKQTLTSLFQDLGNKIKKKVQSKKQKKKKKKKKFLKKKKF